MESIKINNRYLIVGVLCLVVFAGCDRNVTLSDRPENSSWISKSRSLVSRRPESTTSIHQNLGHVLAEGQTIRHTFLIPNYSSNPLKFLASEASTPCCSAVECLPEAETPPGETAIVEVVFRPGHNSGRKLLKFFVRTNNESKPVIELSLSANVHPRYEFRPDEAKPPSTMVGKGLRCVYRGVGHGRLGERSLSPASIEATGGVVVSRIGEAVEASLANDLIEARSGEILIDFPASDFPGVRREILTFRWDDGRVENQDIVWTINPAITAVPSALVLKASGSNREVRTIQLTSADRPFRILSVNGVGFAEPIVLPAGSSRNHRIDLVFDTTTLRSGYGPTIHIETDHGDARSVELGVLVLAAPRS